MWRIPVPAAMSECWQRSSAAAISDLVVLATVTLLLTAAPEASAQEHPRLVLTRDGVEEIRQHLGSVPLFDASVSAARREVDAELALGIDTPVPRDFSGGYTHERHKRNFLIAEKAGRLFQILQDESYARYVRDMLFQYAAMYPDLPRHPRERSYARGKLFWQCLNDANWLLYMAQAYDAIYDWLSPEEREELNRNLFRPFADFISLENPQFFNRVHNHSTWGNAAVGMIGLVMDDEELIERALYGIQGRAAAADETDDDGGFIRLEGQKVGFLANLEEPFSPDGYYTEGPYYQRYAMYPFLVFAVAMHNARPGSAVLSHKDGVLLKAVHALLNLSDADGEFFPLNDAQKGMSYYSRSLVAAVDMGYFYGERDPQLLSIAAEQGEVLLDQAGLAVARAIADGQAAPFLRRSINLRDGPDGKQGGVAVLRGADDGLALVFKYAAQGLSHGHYDKLSISLYDGGDEILQDYGLVRFVNIEQKGGGNYLKENSSWAKQTIAHNTVVQDEISHFGGDYATGSRHHSELHFYDDSDADVQVVSALERNAYPGTTLQRTLAVIARDGAPPFVLDLARVSSGAPHRYDLPYYFHGQPIDTNFDVVVPGQLQPLGAANGYQHLYLEGSAEPPATGAQFTWLMQGKFYALTAAFNARDKILFARAGASDPDFNLRRDPALILRRDVAGDTLFASALEPLGSYSPVSELSHLHGDAITGIDVLLDSERYTAVAVRRRRATPMIFVVSNTEASASARHQLEVEGASYAWQGPFLWSELSDHAGD